VFLSLILGANACGDKVDPEAEAAKLRSDLAEADARLRNHMVEDAQKIYLRILEKYPHNPDAEFGMAQVRFAEDDLKSTEVLLKRVVEAKPDDPKVHAKLGHVYFLTKRHGESAEEYKRAFELEPDNGEYGLAYGVGLKNSEQYAEAEAVLRKVAELDPMVRFVYTELGDSVRAQGRLDEALKIYMKAQNTYASDKMARAGAAFVYEAQGKNALALDEWSAYIRMDCCSPYSNDVAKKKIMELQVKIPAMEGETPTDAAQAEGEQPAAEQPAAEQPAAEQPAAEQPAAEQPAAEQPAAEQPADAKATG